MQHSSPSNSDLADDFELHSKVAQRLLPLPFPPPPPDHSSAFQSQHPPPSPNPAFPSRPPSTEPGQTPGGGSSIGMSGSSRPDAAFAVRSVPCKVILPEGAAILQDLTPPFSMTGESSDAAALLPFLSCLGMLTLGHQRPPDNAPRPPPASPPAPLPSGG